MEGENLQAYSDLLLHVEASQFFSCRMIDTGAVYAYIASNASTYSKIKLFPIFS